MEMALAANGTRGGGHRAGPRRRAEPGEEKLVFNRFWRADPSRARRPAAPAWACRSAWRTPGCTAAGWRRGAPGRGRPVPADPADDRRRGAHRLAAAAAPTGPAPPGEPDVSRLPAAGRGRRRGAGAARPAAARCPRARRPSEITQVAEPSDNSVGVEPLAPRGRGDAGGGRPRLHRRQLPASCATTRWPGSTSPPTPRAAGPTATASRCISPDYAPVQTQAGIVEVTGDGGRHGRPARGLHRRRAGSVYRQAFTLSDDVGRVADHRPARRPAAAGAGLRPHLRPRQRLLPGPHRHPRRPGPAVPDHRRARSPTSWWSG